MAHFATYPENNEGKICSYLLYASDSLARHQTVDNLAYFKTKLSSKNSYLSFAGASQK